ncbi:hypothetical protein H2200_005999 [Cladophialophora chaetospira]|uniref:Uncharacterized protein n=1 Tax=Cladophialophora chaetospira TaxID=386627 RepID=A0AA38XA86_9EURO|nr:hypothetical protein H2200_005999 [Cladophialophora chaetospira]
MTTEFLPELRYRVAGFLTAEADGQDDAARDDAWRTLFLLRLTCKDFAQIAIIKRVLFKELTLYATEPSATRVRDADLSFLTPFVQTVTLIPTEYDVDLLFADYHALRTSLGENTMPEEEMSRDFTTRHGMARRDDAVIKNGELARIWGKLFMQLQAIHSINVPARIGDHPLLPDLEYDHEVSELRDLIRNRSQDNYHQFFRTIVECLAYTTPNFKTIDIDCEIVNSFRDWTGAAWQQLDLHGLSSLKFTSFDFWDELDSTQRPQRDESIMHAVGRFLTKCSSNLQTFKLDRFVDFPTLEPPLLTSYGLRGLRFLSLGGLWIISHRLGKDIANMPHLETIHLRDCKPGDDDVDWKPVFDAIRHHKMPMYVHFDGCYSQKSNGWEHCNVLMDPAAFDTSLAEAERDVDRDLILYLANRGPWTGLLQKTFG